MMKIDSKSRKSKQNDDFKGLIRSQGSKNQGNRLENDENRLKIHENPRKMMLLGSKFKVSGSQIIKIQQIYGLRAQNQWF